jgi:hypothetical protein
MRGTHRRNGAGVSRRVAASYLPLALHGALDLHGVLRFSVETAKVVER